jgi:hypothetical protein
MDRITKQLVTDFLQTQDIESKGDSNDFLV